MSGSTSAGLTGDWWRPMIKACSNLSATHPGMPQPSGAKSRAMPGPSWVVRTTRPCIWMKPALSKRGPLRWACNANTAAAWASWKIARWGCLPVWGKGSGWPWLILNCFCLKAGCRIKRAVAKPGSPRRRVADSQAVRRSAAAWVQAGFGGACRTVALRASTRGA